MAASWLAAPGASVLLSVLLFPPPPLRRPSILTAWAAVAVCKIIQKLVGCAARIKWPNDILLGGRKVCGILIEQGRGTVAGIGLNVRQSNRLPATPACARQPRSRAGAAAAGHERRGP